MATSEILDFEALAAPIPGGHPTGTELRKDFSPVSLYQQLKTARGKAMQAERAMATQDDPSAIEPPDWRTVLKLGQEILAKQSKDLEVTSFTIEALVRLHGFAGLRDGFRLVRELVENFWADLYPIPDEDERGMAPEAARVEPLVSLSGAGGEGVLIGPIRRTAITEPGSHRALSVSDYMQAGQLEKLEPEQRQRRIDQGLASLEMFKEAVAESSPDFFRALLDDLAQAQDELQRLAALLDEKCGKDESGYPLAPPTSNLHNVLDECRRQLADLTRDILGDEADVEETETAPGDNLPVARKNGELKAVQTREDAFRALEQVARFFRQTEPHSPVSYALEQAVRWGRMSLPELLGELLEDGGAREQIYKRVGIKVQENTD